MIKEHKNILLLLFFISFGAYFNTLNHEFVLDDKIVITENSFTKQGVAGIKDIFSNDSMTGFFGMDKNLVSGGRYRPLSMAIHAVEWEMFGNNPLWFHLFNVLFYGLSVCLLFLVLIGLFPVSTSSAPYLGIAFLAALFFAINPLHTEVVANIKSRDEIVSVLFALLSFWLYLEYLTSRKWALLISASSVFFLSLLSKESTIVFVVIVPLMIFYRMDEINRRDLIVISSCLALISATYIVMRVGVIGSAKMEITKELMNNPFLNATGSEKWATIFYTLFLYLKLSFWPHPLTHDYYPKQIPIVGWDDPIAITSFLLHVALVVFAIYGLRKKNLNSLFVWIYLGGLGLYMNILFPIGTFMNERFLYISTIGTALFFAFLLSSKIKSPKLAYAIVGVISLGYLFKTIDRNRAWETDATLSLTDVEVSSMSAKCNMAAGLALLDQSELQKNSALEKRDLKQSVQYLTKSIEIYPTYLPPTLLMGNALTKLKEYKSGIEYYKRCLQLSPGYSFALQNLEFIGQEATNDGQFEVGLSAYLLVIEKSKAKANVYEKVGEIYGKDLNQPGKALSYLQKALEMDPKDGEKSQKLGIVLGLLGRHVEAIEVFRNGIENKPENGRLWLNLAISMQAIGNMQEADQCFLRAFELEPELKNG